MSPGFEKSAVTCSTGGVCLGPIGAHPPIHAILTTTDHHVPPLQICGGSIVGGNNLFQRNGQLPPSHFGLLVELLNGQEHHNHVL